MRRLEQLIDICRKETGNDRYTEGNFGSGVSQGVFTQHFRDAQDQLYMHIVSTKNKFFKKTLEIPVVPMQAQYPWPDDIYVRALETLQWYDIRYKACPVTILKGYTKEKLSGRVGFPFQYIPNNAGIELNPPVNYGTLAFSYERKLPALQKKSGLITVATMVGSDLTALEVANTGVYDESEINSDFFLCVVDKFGNVKARNIQYDSVSAGVFTLPAQGLAAGQSVSVGDFILVGKNTCNIPDLPDICEGYLRKYVIYRVKYGDSSNWTKEAKEDLSTYVALIDDTFARPSEDITEIPITNTDYL